MSKRKSAYLRYLESAHWRRLRKQAFERDSYQCVGCGSEINLRGHHLRYRKNLHNCTVDDIETRCDESHKSLHAGKKRARTLKRQGIKAWRRLLSIDMAVFRHELNQS